MTPSTDAGNNSGTHDDATSGSTESTGFAERITGSNDRQDPDGLITLDDLPDRTADASDLSALARKANQYGGGSDQGSGT